MGVYKKMHMSPRVLLLLLALGSSGDSSVKPHNLCLGYLSASGGEGLLLYRKDFFICSSVCAQGYLEHPALV